MIKLIKDEFKALGKIILPVYLVWVVLALISRVQVLLLISNSFVARSEILKFIACIIIVCFIFMSFGAIIFALFAGAKKYYKTMLVAKDDLTSTSAFNNASFIFSRLIVNYVFIILGLVLFVLLMPVVFFNSEFGFVEVKLLINSMFQASIVGSLSSGVIIFMLTNVVKQLVNLAAVIVVIYFCLTIARGSKKLIGVILLACLAFIGKLIDVFIKRYIYNMHGGYENNLIKNLGFGGLFESQYFTMAEFDLYIKMLTEYLLIGTLVAIVTIVIFYALTVLILNKKTKSKAKLEIIE